jgi:hypothetical protein
MRVATTLDENTCRQSPELKQMLLDMVDEPLPNSKRFFGTCAAVQQAVRLLVSAAYFNARMRPAG